MVVADRIFPASVVDVRPETKAHSRGEDGIVSTGDPAHGWMQTGDQGQPVEGID